jgi:uncharacterized membrane protein
MALGWQVWALLSAGFAALTAIFAKIGVEGVNSDFATLIRTCVVIVVLTAIVGPPGSSSRCGRFLRKPGSFSPCPVSGPALRGSAIFAR